jgi:hypothetical protein
LCVLLCVCWQRRDEGGGAGCLAWGSRRIRGWFVRSFVHMDRALRPPPVDWLNIAWLWAGRPRGNAAGQGRVHFTCSVAVVQPRPTAAGGSCSVAGKAGVVRQRRSLAGTVKFWISGGVKQNSTRWRSTTVQRRCRLPLAFAGYDDLGAFRLVKAPYYPSGLDNRSKHE